MPDRTVIALLEGNRTHAQALPEDYFAEVQDTQHPSVVSMCCSDSRVPQQAMWDVSEPGWLFTPSNIGNQVWEDSEGRRVVNGSVLYPIAVTGTETAVVVGHTGCGAITAAYRWVTDGTEIDLPSIERRIRSLVPVIEDGLASEVVDAGAPDRAVIDQLVEYNVDCQVGFLRNAGAVPDDVAVYGFVYDFQRVYGDVPGRAYLVNADGETDQAAIAAGLPAEFDGAVRSLLH